MTASTAVLSGALLTQLAVGTLCAGDKLSVKIIDRQENSGSYSYVIPARSQTNVSANAGCNTIGTYTNCSGNGTATTTGTPAVFGSYQVSGATFTLRLPDGRLAVVNCNSKPNWTDWGQPPHRSCRIPLVDDLVAEFDGDKAKLEWAVSIDGKKMRSETYRIVAIVGGPAK